MATIRLSRIKIVASLIFAVIFPSIYPQSSLAIDNSNIKSESLYPISIYPTPYGASQYFSGNNGEILVAFQNFSSNSSWFNLSKFKAGQLEGIPGFNVTPSSPSFVNSWIRDQIIPGIFLASSRVECTLPQGIGCPEETGIVNKIINSNGTIIAANINFGKFNDSNISGIMGNKILFSNTVDLSEKQSRIRKYASEFSLYDISDYSNPKKLWNTSQLELINPEQPEFGSADSHIFTDGGTLIQLAGVDGDSGNCKNFLKLDKNGALDSRWISDIEKRIQSKGGKRDFPLSWVWTSGKRTGPNRILFSASTGKPSPDCTGNTQGNQVNILTNNSGEVIDVFLDQDFTFKYEDEIIECSNEIGCIWTNSLRQLSWADLNLNRSTTAPWFTLAPPKDFNVEFNVYNRATRISNQVSAVIPSWTGSELLGIHNKVATYLVTATYKDSVNKLSAQQTFMAEYRIPDALYQVKRSLNTTSKKITITCVKKKTISKKVSGLNPKCPRGYRQSD